MAETNPFTVIRNTYARSAVLPAIWLHRAVTNTPRYNEMMAALGPDMTVKRWLREFAQQHLDSYGVMATYIHRKARRRVGGPDKLIEEPAPQVRRYLAWRINMCLHRVRCPVCEEQFTRNHVDRCLLQGRGATQNCPESCTDSNYNQLDDLLNSGKYEQFDNIMDVMEELQEEQRH